jgi:hypothetical protein
MTELNGNFYWVNRIDADTFNLMSENQTLLDTTQFLRLYFWGDCRTPPRSFLQKSGTSWSRWVFTAGGHLPVGQIMILMFCGVPAGPDADTGASEYNDFSIGTSDSDGFVFTIPSRI